MKLWHKYVKKTAAFIMNWAGFLSALIFLIKMKTDWEVKNTEGVPKEYLATIYWQNITSEKFKFTYVLSFWTLIMWIRVLIIIRANKFLGPLINIFARMLQELFKFMVLYAIIFIIFLCIAVLFFADKEQYSGLWNGAQSMFEISMGQFDFSVYQTVSFQIDKEAGIIFIWIYIIIQNITLLNFVIAILSNVYEELKQKSNILYLKTIIEQY